MTSNLMDTEPGGEQTQYEGEYTDVLPKAKLPGQLGGKPSTGVNPQSNTTPSSAQNPAPSSSKSPNSSSASDSPPIAGAEKSAGQTASLSGTSSQGEGVENAAKARREQGYGGREDMDRTIGA